MGSQLGYEFLRPIFVPPPGLQQGGCDAELVRLADDGVHGNGHGMMVERNNAEVLGVITDWVTRKLAR